MTDKNQTETVDEALATTETTNEIAMPVAVTTITGQRGFIDPAHVTHMHEYKHQKSDTEHHIGTEIGTTGGLIVRVIETIEELAAFFGWTF